MTATAIEIRSELAPEAFARALRQIPGVIERGNHRYLDDRRARMASVTVTGQDAQIKFRAGALRRPDGSYGGGTLYIILANLTGRITETPNGSVFSGGLRTLNARADALIRLLPPVTFTAVVATLVVAVVAPSVVLIPGVVGTGGLSGLVAGLIAARWGWKQRSVEIARLFLVINDATASTTADVPGQSGHGLAAGLFGPWLHDVPASAILEAMRRLEQSPDEIGAVGEATHNRQP
jgi:hypothetical protein